MIKEIGTHKIEFFDSIDTLPFSRFNAFNKYVMLDAHLGNTVFDWDKLMNKVNQFLKSNMLKEAMEEMQNIRQVVHNILTENSVKGLAFAAMIKSIDGKEITDYSINSMNEILRRLESFGLTGTHVYEGIEDVKKK